MKQLLTKIALPATLALALATTSLGASFTTPDNVPGKEYSNNRDKDAAWNVDHLQNLHWDGLGGNSDAFDYSGSAPIGGAGPMDPDQVDALAHTNDAFFKDLTINAPNVGMVLSLQNENNVRSHDATGTAAVWASANQVRGVPAHTQNADDIDALELWGPETFSDADHFSTGGDSLGLGVSVYHYDSGTHTSSPYIFHNQILNQLNQDFHLDLQVIDVDGMMLNDIKENSTSFDIGDTIMFTLQPTGPLDGGEIFVWQNGAPIQYLNQGGTIWNTANNVSGIFGSNSENINALEAVVAVPEPMTCGLLALGAAMLKRRRHQKS